MEYSERRFNRCHFDSRSIGATLFTFFSVMLRRALFDSDSEDSAPPVRSAEADNSDGQAEVVAQVETGNAVESDTEGDPSGLGAVTA